MAGSRSAQSRQKQRDAREKGVGMSVTLDGTTYSVYEDDLSANDTRALRREFGLSFVGIVRALKADPDIDLFAAIVWLARRVNGERDLEFEDVGGAFTYNSDWEVGDPDDKPAEDGLPET